MKNKTKIFIIFIIFLLIIGNYSTYIFVIKDRNLETPNIILVLTMLNDFIISTPSFIYYIITKYIEEEQKKEKIIELVRELETNHLEEREILLNIIEKQHKQLEKYKKVINKKSIADNIQ